ncbi:WGxxGxxG family protein [Paenibacillus abyssi]|uniref:MYXO-CTERM domain-containing protein n=1 Tax=Paenibacillus abyssi TaxID=1340531 RepID=A0A917FX63_9BACL|nr:WGxxGxxG family protein [Paenibacillus abyssi]GGG11480.1 hypothetical protein GCM10010916_30400 [Paenibacillus abyssi]
MKRISISFLLVASLMLILAVPAFADNMKNDNNDSKMGMNGASYYRSNTSRSNNITYGSTMDRTPTRGDARAYGYNRVTTDGNYRNYSMNSTDGATALNQRYRATAAADRDGMDWGWLGLLGLLGLTGLRGRNNDREKA